MCLPGASHVGPWMRRECWSASKVSMWKSFLQKSDHISTDTISKLWESWRKRSSLYLLPRTQQTSAATGKPPWPSSEGGRFVETFPNILSWTDRLVQSSQRTDELLEKIQPFLRRAAASLSTASGFRLSTEILCWLEPWIFANRSKGH